MNRDAQVPSTRPDLPATLIDRVGLDLEITDFGKRQLDGPLVAFAPHRHVAPRRAAQRFLAAARGDDFPAKDCVATEISPQPTPPSIR